MKFSEIYSLGLSQAELDFVDIEPGRDTPLFLDPYALEAREDALSDKFNKYILSYFEQLVVAAHKRDQRIGEYLLSHLGEPMETHLGVASEGNSGRGIGDTQARKMFESIMASRAASTGLLQDLTDLALFVPNIGRDKISDITTNILRKPLMDYTAAQCAIHHIPTRSVVSEYCWDCDRLEWRQAEVNLPVENGLPIVLVPKYLVRYVVGVDHSEYYRHFVIEFYKAHHLQKNDSFVQVLKNKKRIVRIGALQQEYPKSKDFLAEFSSEHPDIIDAYKRQLRDGASKIPPIDPEGFSRPALAQFLIDELQKIPAGHAGATNYHRLANAILSFLFFPNLIYPELEAEINEGRKRIDIRYTNGQFSGVFSRIAVHSDFNSIYIPVECKNYSEDPGNPEIDQLIGRFNRDYGRAGILMFRICAGKRERLIASCRDALVAGQGLVIPMDDNFVVNLLTHVANGDGIKVERVMDGLMREIMS